MPSSHCEKLAVLKLLQENVTNSASLTAEVEKASEVLINNVKLGLKDIACDKIICAIQDKDFGVETEAYEAAIAIYQIERNLFLEVFSDVFKDIDLDECLPQVLNSLNNFPDCGPIVDAYCKLFEFISEFSEHLWAYECGVRKLLQNPNLTGKEKKKVNDLLAEILEVEASYLKYNAAMSYFDDL